jgi:septal ring factor EnvC (AmiA/AmiB activator)
LTRLVRRGAAATLAYAPRLASSLRRRARIVLWLGIVAHSVVVSAQPRADAQARRVTDRIQALQREAAQLAVQSRTLLGELRALEIERELRTAQATQAEAAAAAAQQALVTTTARVADLEQQRAMQLPDMRAQLIDIYKRGHTGYAQLLFGAHDMRELARAARAVASLAVVDQRRLARHRATLDALRTERRALERETDELRNRRLEAEQARSAAQRAIASRMTLIARIDSRRDLAAQYAGELQEAYDRLQQQIRATRPARVEVPLTPFQRALDWPVTGRVTARFGHAERPGGAAARTGIDIAAPEGTSVKAVHGGTVAFAGLFTGFGTLVILDHGSNNFTLYGYLSSLAVDRGDVVEAGDELGRAGLGPGNAPAVYFEVRIDGRQADPLQWLKPRS